MRVSEFRAALERRTPSDDLVVIPVETMAVSVGPTPTVSIQGIAGGFDWNQGKLLLIPEGKLHRCDEVYQKEQTSSRDKGQALAFIWMSARNKSLTADQRLRAINATLRRFGFNHGLED